MTNSNPTNAPVETVNSSMVKVTTQTLGVANERVRDLAGFILSPKEIHTAVVKFLMMYSIEEDDIYSVKVGTTKDNELKIIAEVRAKALQGRKKSRSWMDFDEYDNNESLISDTFYQAWHNKLYHGKRKHLPLRQVRRNNGKDKYVAIEINPEIFIAFAYDINFCDKMYKISAPAKRWANSKQLDDMSGKERKRYKAMQQEFANYGITNCMFAVVTFSAKSYYKMPNGDSTEGFHPNQVDDYYANRD